MEGPYVIQAMIISAIPAAESMAMKLRNREESRLRVMRSLVLNSQTRPPGNSKGYLKDALRLQLHAWVDGEIKLCVTEVLVETGPFAVVTSGEDESIDQKLEMMTCIYLSGELVYKITH